MQNELSSKQDTLTAGTGIDITNNVISNTQTSAEWGNITGTLSNQTDLNTALGNKQDTLVSGSNIKTINNNSILGSGDIEIQGGAGETLPVGTEVDFDGQASDIPVGWEQVDSETLIDTLNAVSGQASVSKTITTDLSQYRFIGMRIHYDGGGYNIYFGNTIFPISLLKTSGAGLQNRDARWNTTSVIYGFELMSNNTTLNNFTLLYWRADGNFSSGDQQAYHLELYGIR